MNNFFSKTKKYWLIFLLALLASFLVFIYLRPKKSEIVQTPNLSPTPSIKISYGRIDGDSLPSGTNIFIAAKTSVDQAQIYYRQPQELSETNIFDLARFWEFSNQPKVIDQNLYIWDDGKQSLSINKNKGVITYEKYLEKIPSEGQFPDPNQALSLLKNILNRLEIISNTNEIEVVKRSFLKYSTETYQETLPQSADLVKYDLSLRLSGFPLITFFAQPLVEASFTKDASLIKLRINSVFISGQKGEAYPLKNSEEIQNAVIKEGRIVSIGTGEVGVEKRIDSISINNIELAYFLFQTSDSKILPVWILEGSANIKGKGIFSIEILLPAIKSQYIFIPES